MSNATFRSGINFWRRRPYVEKPVVLVVEDEVLVRLGALELVKSAGCDALEAQNADEAIRILEQRPDIRLVFTDIDMPGTMDGLKLSHYVRDRWPPIHIIVASGKAIIEENQLPSGARFFPKPYQDEPIVDAIASFFRTDRSDCLRSSPYRG